MVASSGLWMACGDGRSGVEERVCMGGYPSLKQFGKRAEGIQVALLGRGVVILMAVMVVDHRPINPPSFHGQCTPLSPIGNPYISQQQRISFSCIASSWLSYPPPSPSLPPIGNSSLSLSHWQLIPLPSVTHLSLPSATHLFLPSATPMNNHHHQTLRESSVWKSGETGNSTAIVNSTPQRPFTPVGGDGSGGRWRW